MTAETAAPRACARILNNQGGLGIDESKSKGISDAGVALNVQATVDWINGGANTFV